LFRTALVERTAYREMFLSGQPPSLIEPHRGAGLEIWALIEEIRMVLAQDKKQSSTRKILEVQA
jgi:chromosome partitioning protein